MWPSAACKEETWLGCRAGSQSRGPCPALSPCCCWGMWSCYSSICGVLPGNPLQLERFQCLSLQEMLWQWLGWGRKGRKAKLYEKAANKKQRQMCPGGDLVWSHCADGIWFCDASGHVSFLFSISKSACEEKWLWWLFVMLLLDKSNSIVGCQWVSLSLFFFLF